MNTFKVILIISICFYLSLNTSFSQIQKSESEVSVSLYNGGNWQAYNYGLKNLNYNFGLQSEYKLKKNISAVIDAGFDFEHFKEVKSVLSGFSTGSSTKLVMFKFTAGINYYIPLQKSAKIFLNANIGDYVERILYPGVGLATELVNPVDDSWSSHFGISTGAGFENNLLKNVKWTFHFKYHYIFNRNVDLSNLGIEQKNWDMKFFNINLGLKYYF